MPSRTIPLIFKRKSLHQLFGAYQSSFKGSGLIFSESRPYTSGDPYHRIDRLTTAKKQDIYLKQFEEERLLRVLLVVTGGESMHFASTTPTKRDMIQTLAQLFFESVLTNGDQIGHLLMDGQTQYWHRPARQAQQIAFFTQHFGSISFGGKSPSASQIASFIQKHHLHHHLILWISDTPVRADEQILHAIATKNDLLYLQLFDPFERTGVRPDEGVEVFSLQNDTTTASYRDDPGSRQRYQETIDAQITETRRLLNSRGITYHTAMTTDDPFATLVQLFETHSRMHSR